MTTLPNISLDTMWRYLAAAEDEDFSARQLDESEWDTLDSLVKLPETLPDDAQVVWLRHTTKLDPLGICAVYYLDLRDVPARTEIYVNGKPVGRHKPRSGRFAVDVTGFVYLGQNIITLRLDLSSRVEGAVFGEVRLQAIPCDEI